jgi:hypothetical protein
VSDEPGDGERGGKGPLRRTLDLCFFAPVGAAVTLAEELPELIEKGRRRVELQLGNAHVVGRFVVHKGRRDLAGRIEDILNNGVEAARAAVEAERAAAPPATAAAPDAADAAGVADTAGVADAADAADEKAVSDAPAAPTTPAAAVVHTPEPAPDPFAEATVQRALADYDTLSASQVVRRLENLGDEELQAVRRYEASHRNRRTILNRASQLLDSGAAEPSAG